MTERRKIAGIRCSCSTLLQESAANEGTDLLQLLLVSPTIRLFFETWDFRDYCPKWHVVPTEEVVVLVVVHPAVIVFERKSDSTREQYLLISIILCHG